ncbi:uncharacterized protein LOC144513399 [Sander vitreus]
MSFTNVGKNVLFPRRKRGSGKPSESQHERPSHFDLLLLPLQLKTAALVSFPGFGNYVDDSGQLPRFRPTHLSRSASTTGVSPPGLPSRTAPAPCTDPCRPSCRCITLPGTPHVLQYHADAERGQQTLVVPGLQRAEHGPAGQQGSAVLPEKSLQDGSPIDVYLQTEGGDIGVYCYSPLDGNTTFFCKNECKEKGELLIETRNDTAQSGRYRIEYETLIANTYLAVSISQLTKSDSGRYRCGLNTSLSSDSYSDFEVIVVDALLTRNPPEVKTFYKTTGDNIIVSCFFSVSGSRKYFCKGECEDKDILIETSDVSAETDRYSIRYVGGFVLGGFVYVTISQLTRSDSGLYRCGLNTSFSPDPYQEFRIVVTDGEIQSVLLYLVVILLIIVIICLLALAIVCIRRKHKPNASTGGQSDGRNVKVAPDFSNGNCNPAFNMEDSAYMNLDPFSRDKDHSYSTISKIQLP